MESIFSKSYFINNTKHVAIAFILILLSPPIHSEDFEFEQDDMDLELQVDEALEETEVAEDIVNELKKDLIKQKILFKRAKARTTTKVKRIRVKRAKAVNAIRKLEQKISYWKKKTQQQVLKLKNEQQNYTGTIRKYIDKKTELKVQKENFASNNVQSRSLPNKEIELAEDQLSSEKRLPSSDSEVPFILSLTRDCNLRRTANLKRLDNIVRIAQKGERLSLSNLNWRWYIVSDSMEPLFVSKKCFTTQ